MCDSAIHPDHESVTFKPGTRGCYAFAEAVGLELEPFQRMIARTTLGEQPESLILISRGER